MNWTGRIAELFVRNGRLSLLLVVTLFVWGAFAFVGTPKQYNPRITAPAFQIDVSFPGASRQEVLEQVTKPLEGVLADIPGVEDIFSETRGGGRVSVTVNFVVGGDVDSAKIALADKIESNLDLAPLGIETPRIRSIDPDDVPVLTLAIRSETKSPAELRRFAFRLKERLATVPGTSNIEVVGGRRKELLVAIDPFKLSRSGVSLRDIELALRRNNVFAQVGKIREAERHIPIEVAGTVPDARAVAELAVITGDFGQMRIRDIARVSTVTEEVETYVRHSSSGKNGDLGDRVVLLSIAKKRGTNIADVTEAIRAQLSHLRAHFIPKDIHGEVLVDEGRTAHDEIMGLAANLATAILIVVAVLFVFLDARAAFLTAISIPLTLAVVFGIAHVTGQNINRITLFALILSLGLLVDNATVVVENIVRHLEQPGERGRIERVLRAVSEVGPGLSMSTVTTVLAFIPMAFVTGMMGPYMGPIPFFVPAAIIVSLLLALSLYPWMAGALLRGPESSVESVSSRWPAVDRILGPVGSAARRLFARARPLAGALAAVGARVYGSYRNLLHRMLVERRVRRRVLGLVLLLLVAVMLLPAVGLVRFRMLPKADRQQFFLYVDLPEGVTPRETLRISEGLRRVLNAGSSHVRMTQIYVGRPPILDFNGLFRGTAGRSGSHQATIRVGFDHPNERDLTSVELVRDLRPQLVKAAAELSPERPVLLKLVEDPPGPPVLSTLLVRVRGYDETLLRRVAADLLPRIERVPGVTDLDDSVPAAHSVITVRVNHERASKRRVSAAAIAETLAASYRGRVIGIQHGGDKIEQEFIRLRMDGRFRKSPRDLERIYLYNDVRIRVPLAELVQFVEEPAVFPARRENRLDTVYIYGEMSGRSITYAGIDIISMLWSYRLPEGTAAVLERSLFGVRLVSADGREVEISLGGEWELTLEVFRDLGLAMGVAIFLIYVVLTAQFGSFRDPLIVMSAIPLSLVGVLPGFLVLGWLTGLYFNATSMIGVIALAGIAVNNSIMLMEYVRGLRPTGMPLEQALVEAGSTRFRPILLTTATTILGSLTIVGDPVWAGLAYAVITGLGVSSILTLLVFPSLYYLLRRRDWPAEVA